MFFYRSDLVKRLDELEERIQDLERAIDQLGDCRRQKFIMRIDEIETELLAFTNCMKFISKEIQDVFKAKENIENCKE